jgi:putative ABC transport system ATP-binding protein
MVEVKQLGKVYPGKVTEQPLTDLNFPVEECEMVAVMGPSGSGKSTLINLLATLYEPSWGSMLIDGVDTATFKRKAMTSFRRETLGIIFQEFNLLDSLTLGENMLVPLMLSGKKAKLTREEMEELARRLQIDDLLDKQVDEVSGGQRP